MAPQDGCGHGCRVLRGIDSGSISQKSWSRLSSTSCLRRKATALAQGRSRRGNTTTRDDSNHRHRRGYVTVKLPRHMIYKKLASGHVAYYYNVPSRYRAMKCPVSNEPLGMDYAVASKRAATLNGLFDEWEASRKGVPVTGASTPLIG